MNKEQTISYLREALRLETDRITQHKTMNWMKKRINSLAIPNRITKEVITMPILRSSGFEWFLFILFSLVELLIIMIFMDSHGSGVLFLGIIFFAIPLFYFASIIKNNKKLNQDDQEEYDYNVKRAKQKYENALEEEQRRIEKETKQKAALSTDLTILKQQNEETAAALNKLYDLGIVYPKYRNISAISMFIQYLESGMCSEFGGPNGCYMVYEQELRTGAIISSIDEMSKAVVNSIGELNYNLSRNQYELYNAISESNSQIKRLCNTTDDIKRHQAVLEAQNEQQINTTRALGEYVVYRDLLS